MKKTLLVALLALGASACAFDISPDHHDPVDTAADPSDPVVDEVDMTSPECASARPDPNGFSGETMVMGIVHEEQFLKLGAEVDLAPDAGHFSVTFRVLDPETETPVGEVQQIDAVPIDDAGRFSASEVTIVLPPGASSRTDESQTALVDVNGAFCTATGSLQGRFQGWTFTPTVEETDGAWFIAPLSE